MYDVLILKWTINVPRAISVYAYVEVWASECETSSLDITI